MIIILIASLMAVRKLGEMVLRDTEDGEVVYDSILENKEKTKNFWEQMMMASAPQSRFISNLSDAEKIELTNDARQGCFYARPVQVPDPLDVHMETRTEKSEYFFSPETVVQREIRLQQEREAELAREREEALRSARSSAVVTPVPTRQPSGKAAHILIEMELREMHEREEELRRLREQPTHRPDVGHLSQLDRPDESSSQLMSPEEGSGDDFRPQESQMYSAVEQLPGKQPAVVKPLVEAEEEAVPAYMRSHKETPIEREIRLLQEREKELRREKELYQNTSITSPPPAKFTPETYTVASHTINFNDHRSAEHRLATNRIQQEIYETTKREKELQSAGRIQTMSEDTLDSKITRFTDLAEYAIAKKDRKLRKSVSSSNLPLSVSPDNSVPTASECHSYNHSSFTPTNTSNSYCTQMYIATVSPVISVGPKKPLPPVSKKGVMQKFLESHAKVNGQSMAGRTNTPRQGIPEDEVDQIPVGAPSVVSWKRDVTSNLKDQITENRRSSCAPTRRGYQPAEVKIQAELVEMQKREEELSLQRSHHFAQSQPNLIFIGNDEYHNEDVNETYGIAESTQMSHNVLSNPDFPDAGNHISLEHETTLLNRALQQNVRVRSHRLINQWERRIQSNIDYH